MKNKFSEVLNACLTYRVPSIQSRKLVLASIERSELRETEIASEILQPPRTAVPDPLWLDITSIVIGKYVGYDLVLSSLSNLERRPEVDIPILAKIMNGISEWQPTVDQSASLLTAMAGWYEVINPYYEVVDATLQMSIVVLQQYISGQFATEGSEIFDVALTKFLTSANRDHREVVLQVSELHTMFLAHTSGQKIVENVPNIHARSRLYIFFSDVLTSVPSLQDEEILQYLYQSYGPELGEHAVIDCVIGVCDAMCNARSNFPQFYHLHRSFFVNRLPCLLKKLQLSSGSYEYAISQALLKIDAAAFQAMPELDLADAEIDLLMPVNAIDIKVQLISSMLMHALVEPQTACRLLNLEDMPSSSWERLDHSALLAEYEEDNSRLESFVVDLKEYTGNQDQIAYALREKGTVGDYETLLRVCALLCQYPNSLDTFMLFNNDIIPEFVTALDAWAADEEGEIQRSFEVFGSLVLFLRFLCARYDVDLLQFDLDAMSFSKQLACEYDRVLSLEKLPLQKQESFGGWVRALFDNDGISDDLLRSMSPQELYLLLPTLFSQSIEACHSGLLSGDTAKEGIEYFTQPFLLPSVTGALFFMMEKLRLGHSDCRVILQFISALLFPPMISEEARWRLDTILRIIARPLSSALANVPVDEIEASHVDVGALHFALQPHIFFRMPSHTNDLLTRFRDSISALTMWSSIQGMPQQILMPPEYDIRLFQQSLTAFGTKIISDTLLTSLHALEPTNGGFAVDTIAALISLPFPSLDMRHFRKIWNSCRDTTTSKACQRLNAKLNEEKTRIASQSGTGTLPT